MERFRRASALVTVLMLLFASIGTIQAAQKVAAYKGQAGYTFVNSEDRPAHGLVVTLSSNAIVVTANETGHAGPFRNVQGNDTAKIQLMNPAEPIPNEGENSVELTFRSYAKTLKIKSWWWVDEKGKRIGKKNQL